MYDLKKIFFINFCYVCLVKAQFQDTFMMPMFFGCAKLASAKLASAKLASAKPSSAKVASAKLASAKVASAKVFIVLWHWSLEG